MNNKQKLIIGMLISLVIVIITGVLWLVKNSFQYVDEPQHYSQTSSGQSLSWRVEYDSLGRIARTFDPSGRSTDFSYSREKSGLTHSISIDSPDDNDRSLTYDRDGLLTTMVDGQGTAAYRYDSHGRISEIKREGAPVLTYDYDEAGRISEMCIGDFYTITRAYDFLGRLSSIKTPAGTIRYEYRPGEGLVIRSLPNGIKTFYRREGNGELKEITHGYFAEPNSNSYSVLASYSYEHGPDGKIRAISEKSAQGSFERRFDYDSMGRLIHATGAGGQKYIYEYDRFSNRVRASAEGGEGQDCSYDWAGRLVTVNGDSTQYDTNGNLIEATVNNATRTFRYHADGRVAEVMIDDDAAEYRYDGFGRLISRSGTKGQTSYIPDPLSDVWKPLVIDEGGSKTLVLWDGNTPLAIVRKGNVEWLLHDHLGSVRMTADARGKIQETYDYDPFGVPLRKKNVSSPVPGFAGLFWDETAGGYLTMARLYDPHLGTFFQPDPQKRIPTADPDDLSLFTYCGGDPVNFVDLNGAESQSYTSSSFYQTDNNSISVDLWDFSGGLVTSKVESVIRNYAESIPGIVGESSEFANIFSDFVKVPTHTLNAIQYAGSPKAETELINAGFTTISLLTVPVVGMAISGYTIQRELSEIINDYTYSRLLLNRAEKMSSFGGVVLPQAELVRESVFRNDGMFEVKGSGYWIKGGTSRHVTSPKLFRHRITSQAWSNAKIHDVYTNRGTKIYNGLFSVFEEKNEEGANIFNAFEPTSVTVTRKKHEQYTEKSVAGSKMTPIHDVSMDRMIEIPKYFKSISPSSVGGSYVKKEHVKGSPENKYNMPNIGEPKEILPEGIFDEVDDDIKVPTIIDYRDKPPPTPISINGDDPPNGGGGVAAVGRDPVGGVALGGSGGLIDGIGALKGVQVDENGNMILVGEDDKNIELPPLRLDDLVTVFRSVYVNGEGPTVTIDPNPENPEKSAMIIRHSAATDSTYVGWVLYQADRLMKGYGQGVDNITGKDIKSTIPGYDKVIDTVYFGGADPLQRQRGGVWERFWIVPAEATRFQGDRQKLTLFDVPLKVNTQKMKWVGSELVDDLSGKSSPGAKAFTSWFTRNYEGISKEQFLKPPKETGITEAVPVFAELKRIALMTAIAERLRDQGVAMPFWMYDYEVRKIPFEQFTPGLEVKRQKREGSILRTARIFGGVELSAEDKVVRTYSGNTSVSKVPPELKAEIRQNISLANQLEKRVSDVVSPVAAAPLAVKSVQQDKRAYKVTAVPGANTLALGPCRLREPDIVVPLPGNRNLHLTRQYNSFFNPRGLWGNGWTLDLPRIQKVKVPYSRESGKTSYVEAHVLLTPLNSVHGYFLNGRAVKNFSNPQSPTVDSSSPFRALTQANPRFLKGGSTLMLLQKNGQEWYFTESGQLVAWKDGPQVTVYERENGRIKRIVALHGDMLAGEITLEYTGERLSKATGVALAFPSSKPLAVAYSYDNTGHLTRVATDEGRVGYQYQGEKVAAILWKEKSEDSQPEVVRTYAYDARGRVVSEKNGSTGIDYTVKAESNGLVASTRFADGKKNGENRGTELHYDRQMRPQKALSPDGITTEWNYSPSGSVAMTVTAEDGQSLKVIDLPDGKGRTIERNGRPWFSAGYNEAGQLVRLSDMENTLLQQTWRPDGQLASTKTPLQGISFQYNNKGILSSVLSHPFNAGEQFSEWQETRVDAFGRPVEVKDYTGLRIGLRYDETGNLASIRQQSQDGKFSGFDIARNKNGLVDAVRSSWGDTEYLYDKNDVLKSVIANRGNSSASVEFGDGRIYEVTGFDGGRTAFDYYNEKSLDGLLSSVQCADGLNLSYTYNDEKLLSAINLGTKRRVKLEYDKEGRVIAYSLKELIF